MRQNAKERAKDKTPVDELIPGILEFLQNGRCLILQASPGAGKTTRLPPALLRIVNRQVLVLEPRRLAASLSAERVAEEMGERCGQTVGYQIRYEKKAGRDTRLKFITEGVFLRMLLSDPVLSQVDCVVLDEFHERHIQTDVALALVRHLQNTIRPDLKLVIMSATLNPQALQAFIPEARFVHSDIPLFPVEVVFEKSRDRRPLSQAAASMITRCLEEREVSGHMLVFLPGVADIRRTSELLADTAKLRDCIVLELRSETSPDEQRRVFEPSRQRKIILATNVAETSLTIDGVTAVLDSGLARIPAHDAWSGLPLLETRAVSQASCIQRAGRAGRTAPGIALRMYTEHDYLHRRAAEKPEIQRLDLTQILLELKLIADRFPSGARFQIDSLPWFDAPLDQTVRGCEQLLRVLGALDQSGSLSETGRQMADFPLHPRLSRVIVEGMTLNAGPQATLAAALLNEGMILRSGTDADTVSQSDVSTQMELLRNFARGDRGKNLIDAARARRVQRLAAALAENAGFAPELMLQPAPEDALSQALLSGFSDRVAQTRATRDRGDSRIQLLLCTGTTAYLSRASSVRQNEFLLALEAEEQRGHLEAASTAYIGVACGIEKEMLLNGTAEFLREEESFSWDTEAQRARGVNRLRYGTLVLEERPARKDDPRLQETLIQALREQWPRPFDDPESLAALQRRIALLKENGILLSAPAFTADVFDQLLEHVAEGRKSFAEVKQRTLNQYVEDLIPAPDLHLLKKEAPEFVVLGSSRRVPVHYEEGKPPWIASWLQDFFGTRSTPRIVKARVPLVVHLLAPNRRPVQVTQDLESFWLRHYPELRKMLSRRYPKHSWPEDPLKADPHLKR